jgi:hypothetical protein
LQAMHDERQGPFAYPLVRFSAIIGAIKISDRTNAT